MWLGGVSETFEQSQVLFGFEPYLRSTAQITAKAFKQLQNIHPYIRQNIYS
jgi:hypothetical protein